MFKEPIIKFVLGFAGIVIFSMIAIYFYQFGMIFPSNTTFKEAKDLREVYGVIGDFFGGVLNPLLTFCGFGFLIHTIDQNKTMLKLSKEQLEKSTEELELNRQEMKGSKKALKMQAETLKDQAKTQEIQRFENTFFNLLKFYDEAILSLVIYIEVTPEEAYHNGHPDDLEPIKYQGENAFEYLRTDFSSILGNEDSYHTLDEIKQEYERIGLGIFKREYIDYGYIFSYLYLIINLIDSNRLIDNKNFYINILKIKVSDSILFFLMYEGCSRFSKDLMPLAIKYRLFDKIDLGVFCSKHRNIFKEKFLTYNSLQNHPEK